MRTCVFLGEAEYVVAVYMYMRLLGYPAEKVCLLFSMSEFHRVGTFFFVSERRSNTI